MRKKRSYVSARSRNACRTARGPDVGEREAVRDDAVCQSDERRSPRRREPSRPSERARREPVSGRLAGLLRAGLLRAHRPGSSATGSGSPRGAAAGRARVGIVVGEDEPVGVRLREVADRDRAELPEAGGHPACGERREPAQEPDRAEHDREGTRDEEGAGSGETGPEEGDPPVLALGWRDRDVDGVAGLAGESGERVGDDRDESGDVRGVADVGGEEAMERSGRAAAHEGDGPRSRSLRGARGRSRA